MIELTDKQRADKFRNRRQLAWISFFCITLFGGGMIMYGMTNTEASDNISALSFLIGTVFGVWASIVLSYVGAATINQMNERRYDSQTGNMPHQGDIFQSEVDGSR